MIRELANTKLLVPPSISIDKPIENSSIQQLLSTYHSQTTAYNKSTQAESGKGTFQQESRDKKRGDILVDET